MAAVAKLRCDRCGLLCFGVICNRRGRVLALTLIIHSNKMKKNPPGAIFEILVVASRAAIATSTDRDRIRRISQEPQSAERSCSEGFADGRGDADRVQAGEPMITGPGTRHGRFCSGLSRPPTNR